MKFIDFCTDVTAIGVTVVLSLVLIGGVTSQTATQPDAAIAASPNAPSAMASAAIAPEVSLPQPGNRAAEPSPAAPKPLDLADLERSLNALLGPASDGPVPSGAIAAQWPDEDLAVIDLTPEPQPAPQPDATADIPAETAAVDWDDLLADALSLPAVPDSERPDTSVPAPPTKPLIAAPPKRVTDFMADLLGENPQVEVLPPPPSASRPIGRAL